MFFPFLCAFLGSHFWPTPERDCRVREACGCSSRHHMPYNCVSWILQVKPWESAWFLETLFWVTDSCKAAVCQQLLVSYCFLLCFLWVSVKVFMYPLHLSKRHRQEGTMNRLAADLLHVVAHCVYGGLLLATSIRRSCKYLSSGNS